MLKKMTIFVLVSMFAHVSFGDSTLELIKETGRVNQETAHLHGESLELMKDALESQKKISRSCFQAGRSYDQFVLRLEKAQATNPAEAQKLQEMLQVVEKNCGPFAD